MSSAETNLESECFLYFQCGGSEMIFLFKSIQEFDGIFLVRRKLEGKKKTQKRPVANKLEATSIKLFTWKGG